MSKDQQTDGIVMPAAPSVAEVDGLIRVGGTWGEGVDDVARNLNTTLANRSPCYVLQQLAGGSSTRYISVTDASATRRHTWAVPPPPHDYRRTMRGVIEYQTTDGSTTGEVALTSIIGGGSEVATLAASTTLAELDVYTGTIATGVDFELLSAYAHRTAGSGTVRIRSISLWYDVATGAIPDSLGIGADLTLLGADSALTPASLKQIADGQTEADATWTMPVACHCVDGVGGKAGWRTTEDEHWARVAGPILVYPRIGEGKSSLRFAVFPYVAAGCTADIQIIVEADGAGELFDSYTATGVATGLDIEDPDDWLTGLLTVPTGHGGFYTITIRAMVASGTGSVGLVSWSLWSDTA